MPMHLKATLTGTLTFDDADAMKEVVMLHVAIWSAGDFDDDELGDGDPKSCT